MRRWVGGRGSCVRASLVLALVAAQGCWLQTGFDGGRSGFNPGEDTVTAANVADLAEDWSAEVGGSPQATLLWAGNAYVRTRGAVTALATADGTRRWATELAGSSAPAVADGSLWVPQSGLSCGLAEVDLRTGARVGGDSYGGPPLSGLGMSSCGTTDAVARGSKVFVTWTYLGWANSRGCTPELAVAWGSAFEALEHGQGGEGGVSWSLGGGLTTACGFPSPPPPLTTWQPASTAGDSVVVPADTAVTVYPADDCGTTGGLCIPTWSRDLGDGLAGPVVALRTGDLAVPMADGRIVVLDGATGATVWTADASSSGASGRTARLAANATTVFSAGADGTLAAFAAAGCGRPACDPAWTATTPATHVQPSIGGDVLYVGGADGTVTALAAGGCGAATCEALWTGTVPGAVTAPPAIDDGTLYVGSGGQDEPGTVTAFSLPTTPA
jgi:hypothetical protein